VLGSSFNQVSAINTKSGFCSFNKTSKSLILLGRLLAFKYIIFTTSWLVSFSGFELVEFWKHVSSCSPALHRPPRGVVESFRQCRLRLMMVKHPFL